MPKCFLVCFIFWLILHFTFTATPLTSLAFSIHLHCSTVPQLWARLLLDSQSSDQDGGRACVNIYGGLQQDSRGNKNQQPATLTDIFLRQSKTVLPSHLPHISRIKQLSSSRDRRGWRFMPQAPLFSPSSLPSPVCNWKPISSSVSLFYLKCEMFWFICLMKGDSKLE